MINYNEEQQEFIEEHGQQGLDVLKLCDYDIDHATDCMEFINNAEWNVDGYELLVKHKGDLVAAQDEADKIAFLEEYPDWGQALLDNHHGKLEYAQEQAAKFEGSYDSMAEFAQQHVEERGIEIPSLLQDHIDWESLGRDLAHDFTVIDGGNCVYLFRD